MTALLEATALRFGHPGHTVGEDLSLALRAGHVIALLGPNGGGKTTLLETLLGLLPPASADGDQGAEVSILSVKVASSNPGAVQADLVCPGFGFSAIAGSRHFAMHTGRGMRASPVFRYSGGS